MGFRMNVKNRQISFDTMTGLFTYRLGLKQSQGLASWSCTKVQNIVAFSYIQRKTREHRCSIHQVVTQEATLVWSLQKKSG